MYRGWFLDFQQENLENTKVYVVSKYFKYLENKFLFYKMM